MAFLLLHNYTDFIEKMNAIILNTERGFPAEKFYKKNGFQSVDELITLTK
jgi:aminoglycoside 6'-N-acetyltransferase I